MIGGIHQVHTERADGLLLELRSGIHEIDVKKNLVGLSARFGLEAYTEPAMLLVGSLVIPGGNGVGKNKKSGMVAAKFAKPGDQERIFIVEHGQEAFPGNIASTGAVGVVADGLVIG